MEGGRRRRGGASRCERIQRRGRKKTRLASPLMERSRSRRPGINPPRLLISGRGLGEREGQSTGGERSAPHRTVQMFGLQSPPTSPRKPLTRLATAQRSEASTSGPGDVSATKTRRARGESGSSTQTCGGEGGEAFPLLELAAADPQPQAEKAHFFSSKRARREPASGSRRRKVFKPSEHVGDRPQLPSSHGNTVHFQSLTEDKLHLLHVCAPHSDTREKIARNGSLKPLKPL